MPRHSNRLLPQYLQYDLSGIWPVKLYEEHALSVPPAISSFPMPTRSRYPLSMRICLFNPLYNRIRHTRRSRYDNLPCHTEPVLSLKFTLSKVEGKEIGIVFPYFQENGSHLALQLDITSETIPLLRHNRHSTVNAISRLATVFTPHKKRLMSSSNPATVANSAPTTSDVPLCRRLTLFGSRGSPPVH